LQRSLAQTSKLAVFMTRALIASKSRLEMLKGSQRHLRYGNGISAITLQQVEADHEGQGVG